MGQIFNRDQSPAKLLERIITKNKPVEVSSLKEIIDQLHAEVSNYTSPFGKQSLSFDRDKRFVNDYDILMLLCCLNKFLIKDCPSTYKKYIEVINNILNKDLYDYRHRIQYPFENGSRQVSAIELAIINNLENVAIKFLKKLGSLYNNYMDENDDLYRNGNFDFNPLLCHQQPKIEVTQNNNLLMIACYYEMHQLITYMHKKPIILEKQNSEGDTALIIMCRNSMDEEASLWTYDSYRYIWKRNKQQEHAMMIAIRGNMIKTIDTLLESEIGPFHSSYRLNPPWSILRDILKCGCIYGNQKVVKTLLKNYEFNDKTLKEMEGICATDEMKNLFNLPRNDDVHV